ncbi:MAG: PhoD-like phosphatase N-terminal domain-containing protein, partial [Nannocystaceae bacterium]
MTITRRELIRRAGQVGVVSLVAGCSEKDAESETASEVGTESESDSDSDSDSETGGDGLPEYEYDGEPGPENLFEHGVASGDPLPDSVILWTRVSAMGSDTVEVFYEIARDPEFLDRVAAAYVTTDSSRDYTVKIDPGELDAGTTYYYRFQSLGRMSAP